MTSDHSTHHSRVPSPLARPSRVAFVAAFVAALVVAVTFGLRAVDAASTSMTPLRDRPPAIPATPSTTTTSSTTSTTVVPTTTTTTTAPSSIYRSGDEGPQVHSLQQRLLELGFWLPAPDGVYDEPTAQAVMAFQKASGLARDGIAGPRTLAALQVADPVVAREIGDHLEIDLDRQLLIVVHGEETLAFNTSTGRAGWRTPPGRFTIDRQIDGMRHAELGDLWRPKYFDGGIALHGSPSIPGEPASHGCARLHDAAIDLIWDADLAPIGTPVIVY